MNVSSLLSRILPWVLVAVLAFNMSQRRFMEVGVGKRFATLKLAGLILVLWVATIVFRRFAVPELLLVPVAIALVTAAVIWRKSLFPYRLRCPACRTMLPLKQILYEDETRCRSCASGDGITEVER